MKPTEGIAVDGGCSGNPGLAYYRAVDIETGKELFREEIGVATNNIAEFLGLCHAIHYVNTHKIKHPIYTDSRTAMSWAKNKRANSSFSEDFIDARLRKAETFLRIFNFNNVKKWETKLWGEVPADFGLK